MRSSGGNPENEKCFAIRTPQFTEHMTLISDNDDKKMVHDYKYSPSLPL
jgi:hypothetical protein